jgi:hypothetical protein
LVEKENKEEKRRFLLKGQKTPPALGGAALAAGPQSLLPF